MRQQLNILAILFLTFGCSTTKTEYRCGLDPKNFPKHGHESRIIEFKRTAIMDTITAIIEGHIIALNDSGPLIAGAVQLTNEFNNYKVVSDTTGQFKFYHIPAGTYRLIATYVGYRQLASDSLHLGTGDITELIIGMGCLGQDDLKKK